MKKLLLLLVLLNLLACKKPYTILPLTDFTPVEGIWETQWVINPQRDVAPIDIQFTSINKSAHILHVPANSLGYTEGEIILRDVRIVEPEEGILVAEMLLKNGNPAQDSWVATELFFSRVKEYPREQEIIHVNANCRLSCFNSNLDLLRKQ